MSVKNRLFVGVALYCIVTALSCIVAYQFGRRRHEVDVIAAQLGMHIGTRYNMSVGDYERVAKDTDSAVFFLTLMADEKRANFFISPSSKRSLDNMLRRTARLEKMFPLFKNKNTNGWPMGRAAYSNVVMRFEE
jgi:hypothetical protein